MKLRTPRRSAQLKTIKVNIVCRSAFVVSLRIDDCRGALPLGEADADEDDCWAQRDRR